MSKTMIEAWRCDKCQWVWVSSSKPDRCAKCKSRTWDMAVLLDRDRRAPAVGENPAAAPKPILDREPIPKYYVPAKYRK